MVVFAFPRSIFADLFTRRVMTRFRVYILSWHWTCGTDGDLLSTGGTRQARGLIPEELLCYSGFFSNCLAQYFVLGCAYFNDLVSAVKVAMET